MSLGTGITIGALLLLVIVLPFSLSAQEYFREKNLAQPVAQFSYKWARSIFSLLWTLFETSLGVALFVGAVIFTIGHGVQLSTFIVYLIALLAAWRCFPAICLYWTYWQWDGRAHLRFNRAQTQMTYANQEISLTFAVSEIERLSHYAPAPTRAASADYSYTVLHLSNGSKLVVTSLVCDFIEWLALLPAVKTEVIKQHFAWLPTNPKFRKFFNPCAK